MGLRGIETETENYKKKISSLIEEEEMEDLSEDFYRWLKQNSCVKYFVEFSVKVYHMGRVEFQVIEMRESRIIERQKTSYFLERSVSAISSMREYLGEEL